MARLPSGETTIVLVLSFTIILINIMIISQAFKLSDLKERVKVLGSAQQQVQR